jgi:hypothetical protein
LEETGTLAHYPVLTVKRMAGLLDVSFTAASQAVDQLMEARILVERTGYERNRVFASLDALTIINRPFGETPILSDETTSVGQVVVTPNSIVPPYRNNSVRPSLVAWKSTVSVAR